MSGCSTHSISFSKWESRRCSIKDNSNKRRQWQYFFHWICCLYSGKKAGCSSVSQPFAAAEPSANVCIAYAMIQASVLRSVINLWNSDIATRPLNCGCEFRPRQFRGEPLEATHRTPVERHWATDSSSVIFRLFNKQHLLQKEQGQSLLLVFFLGWTA